MVEKNISIINIDDDRWLNYVSKKEEAMIFHHPSWLLNLCESYDFSPFVIVVVDNNAISAGVPFAEIRSPITGRRWVSLPYTDYCFPLYDAADDLELMVDYILELHNSSEAPKIELRWEYPSRQGIQRNNQQVFHTKHLPENPEDYFSALPKKVRQYIRFSNERGVTVKKGTSIQLVKDFYKLQVITRARHGLPVQPWRYFNLLQKNLLEKGLGFVLLGYSEDRRCIAGLIVLHWNNTFTQKYAASSNDLKKELRSTYLLMWKSIEWACHNGYKVLDVGRSFCDNLGLREHKRRWRLEEKALTYSTIGYPQKPLTESGLSKHFKNIIRHSPAFVSRVTGEILYRHFS